MRPPRVLPMDGRDGSVSGYFVLVIAGNSARVARAASKIRVTVKHQVYRGFLGAAVASPRALRMCWLVAVQRCIGMQ